MSLTNQQYDSISRIYEQKQLDNIYLQEQRKQEIYQKIPAYYQLDQDIISLSMEQARNYLKKHGSTSPLSPRQDSLGKLRADLNAIQQKQRALLSDAGYPSDYLELHYSCDLCHDTGFINNQKCKCFKNMEIEYLYDASQLSNILKSNNFSLLSYDYYKGEDLVLFRHAVETCKNFIKNFDTDYHNLFFYGTVGTGKSFLSCCIAKELLDCCKYVIYFSATQLFNNISATMRDKEKSDQLFEALLHSDLLIIDDLGTEYITDYTCTQLFHIINERIQNQKPVIISTNFTSLEELRGHYSDRVFSRIYRNYEMLKLSGQDIRIQQKINQFQ